VNHSPAGAAGLWVIERCKQFPERIVAPALNDKRDCPHWRQHFFGTK
jgi:hypothetical protein